MATMVEDVVSNGRGRAVPRDSIAHLAVGTMVTTDLEAARRQYEHFFGFECVHYATNRMMIRDRRAKYQMEHGERDFFLIDVREVSNIDNPQGNLNHWGFSVGTAEEVTRIREIALQNAEQYRFTKILPITKMHKSHGFYFYDVDSNWWEIEYRAGVSNDSYFSRGDWDAELADAPMIDPPVPISTTRAEVVGQEAFMSHGTTDVVDTVASQRFYEDILNLRSVRHFRVAQFTAGGGDFAFVGINAGPRNARQTSDNRWVVLVDSDRDLLAMHSQALARRDDYGLLDVSAVTDGDHGERSFLICNADTNWFEVSTRSRASYRALFERGDIAVATAARETVAASSTESA